MRACRDGALSISSIAFQIDAETGKRKSKENSVSLVQKSSAGRAGSIDRPKDDDVARFGWTFLLYVAIPDWPTSDTRQALVGD